MNWLNVYKGAHDAAATLHGLQVPVSLRHTHVGAHDAYSDAADLLEAAREQHVAVEILLFDIQRDGGATVNPATLEPRDYRNGFSVSIPGHEMQFQLKAVTPSALTEIVNIYFHRIGAAPNDLGFWIDGELLYVDVSTHVADHAVARNLGYAFKQLAIFDWSTKSVETLQTNAERETKIQRESKQILAADRVVALELIYDELSKRKELDSVEAEYFHGLQLRTFEDIFKAII